MYDLGLRGQHSDARAAVQGSHVHLSSCRRASFCEHLESCYAFFFRHVHKHVGVFGVDCKPEQKASVELRKSEAKISLRIRQVYGEKEASGAKRFEWYSCFKNGRTSREDEERSGKVAFFVCQ